MTPEALIEKVRSEGFELTAKLRVDGPGELSQGLLQLLKERRSDLLSFLCVEPQDLQHPEPISPPPVVPNVPLEPELFRNRGETYRNTAMVHLPSKMLESLMTWTSYYHELRIQHPAGLTLNATPEHVRDALNQHSWGTVHISDDAGRWLVLSWGDVPESALEGLRDLETESLLVPEQVAA